MKMKVRAGVMAFWCLAAWGCGRDDGAPQAAVGSAAARDQTVATDYPLVGTVKKVEPESLTIAHEAIAGFMDAMTMRFAYRDQKSRERLVPGDRVKGTLRVQRAKGIVRDYELINLVVTAKATAEDRDRERLEDGLVGPRRLEIGEVVPDFVMTTQAGKPLKLSELRGKVVVLTFIYTRCPLPDFCPLMDRKFSELSERLVSVPKRAEKVRLISLSFDPEHDTPELLEKHAKMRGAVPPVWTYAVASHAELAKIAPALGLFYQPGNGEVAHNLCTAVIDPAGKLARLEVGKEPNNWQTADMLKTIFGLFINDQE